MACPPTSASGIGPRAARRQPYPGRPGVRQWWSAQFRNALRGLPEQRPGSSQGNRGPPHLHAVEDHQHGNRELIMAKQDLGVLEGLYLIDSDSHYSEPHDLWTSRAPAKLQDLVPLVRPNAKGELRWWLNGKD